MIIKKYVVRDMNEALRSIKDDLGPEAVIISSYKLPPRNLKELFRARKIEVTAAIEDMEKNLPKGIPAAGTIDVSGKENIVSLGIIRTQRPEDSGHAWVQRTVYELPVVKREPLLPFLEKEENDGCLYNMLEDQQGEPDMEQDILYRWKKILLNLEIQGSIVDELLNGINDRLPDKEEEQHEHIKASLANKIAKIVEKTYHINNKARILTFIGPTGVGKTTTLSKLATKLSLIEGKKIALIAVYSHRFGMVEELKFYCDSVRVPVEVIMTPTELTRAVESHSDKDYIFIDTEGIPAKNTGQILKLKSFLEAVGDPQDIYLVLSSTTKNRDLVRITREYRQAGFTKLIFTKLDETETCGSILNVLCLTGTPVAYVTGGQNIPDDINIVQPKSLAGLLLKEVDQHEDLGS